MSEMQLPSLDEEPTKDLVWWLLPAATCSARLEAAQSNIPKADFNRGI